MLAPAAFDAHRRPGRILWVRRGVELPGDVEDWEKRGPELLRECAEDSRGFGRAQVRSIRFGQDMGVWRRNLHGGLLGNVLGPRFLTPERLTGEVVLSESLRVFGVPTPRVFLAWAGLRAGFWNQHLVTEEIPNAQTVFESRKDPQALRAGKELIERVFDFGLWAPDLHPGNLLWQPEEQKCWLIDLADAGLLGRPLGQAERLTRRARYLRFFRKHGGEVPAGA